jgi:hypothetical protein
MGPWTWRLWRIAWANQDYGTISGYRQLWGRLWWKEEAR